MQVMELDFSHFIVWLYIIILKIYIMSRHFIIINTRNKIVKYYICPFNSRESELGW